MRISLSLSVLVCLCVFERGLDGKDAVTAGDVLRRSCLGCHGQKKASGKLRLDSRDGILRGGRSGPAVMPGQSGESLLLTRVQPGAKKRMPPEDEGEPLVEAEIEILRSWIDSGAKARDLESLSKLEPVVLASGSFPSSLQPVYAVAGDPSASRMALGRGITVEVWEIPESDQKPEAKKGEPAPPAPAPRLVKTLAPHKDAVYSLAFSRDGKYLASGEYRTVRVWRTADWKLVGTYDGHADRVLALVFRADGARLAAGSGVPTQGGEVRAWEVETGEPLWSSTPHSDSVLGLDWSEDGSRLITGGADRVTFLINAENGAVEQRLEGHTHHVLGVALRPDGKQAASVSADATLRLWDLENAAVQRESGKHAKAATAVAYRRDGKHVFTTSGDGAVRVWETNSCRQRRSFGESKGYLQSGAFFFGDERFASAEQSGIVRVYDTSKNRLLFTVVAAQP